MIHEKVSNEKKISKLQITWGEKEEKEKWREDSENTEKKSKKTKEKSKNEKKEKTERLRLDWICLRKRFQRKMKRKRETVEEKYFEIWQRKKMKTLDRGWKQAKKEKRKER